jgi:Dullard-like phosphatase family protein
MYNNYNNNYSKPSYSINLEDLMILEEKLIEVINALNTNKIMHNECFEWWNFYYNCTLYRTIETIFKGEDSKIIVSSIKYELYTLLLSYDISFNKNLLNKVFIIIKALLTLNHKNLLIICEYILSKVSNESLGNIWVLKLNDIVNSSKNNLEDDYISFNGHSLSLIEKIKYNTNSISSDIRIILKNYQQNTKTENLVSLYRTLNDKSYEEINKFFRENIIHVDNPNASVLASYVLRENSQFFTVSPPYLKTQNLKNYTLVLDLDETIIHFKVNPNNESEGVLRVRPGIFEFLENVGKYYEIIIFTAATQDYADLLIDAIEDNKIYFDYRLYRQHTIIIENDFVKDLTRLGRPIDKIIIVDNMPQNFRLQKENGINIRAFWGEDPYDTALFELMPILVNIAKEGGDVRKSLAKYRDEIVKNVTMNISKHND